MSSVLSSVRHAAKATDEGIGLPPKAFSYIRFSTPEQEKGDSLRRQIELPEEYAEKHGLVLDDSVRLTDKGLSAYKGVHRTKGALGSSCDWWRLDRFLTAPS